MIKKLIAVIAAALLMLMPALCLAEADTGEGQLSVRGCASVMAVPDRAKVTFGVEITDEEASAAQSRVNEIVNASVKAIKELGIAESAIQTSSISIYREYDYSGDAPVVTGFTASTRISVALDDIALTGAVIDAGLGAGANTISDVAFSSSRQAEYYDQALAAAMDNAMHKAEVLARASECSIVGIDSISEEYSSSMYVARAEEVAYDKVTFDAGYGNSTEISAGQIEISANITAVFNLKMNLADA